MEDSRFLALRAHMAAQLPTILALRVHMAAQLPTILAAQLPTNPLLYVGMAAQLPTGLLYSALLFFTSSFPSQDALLPQHTQSSQF